MFLIVSKLLGILLQLSNILVVVAAAGALALLFRWRRLGVTLIWTALLGFLFIGFGPVGSILMRPLEDSFPRPADDMPEPTGIIMLGGFVSYPSFTRGAISLTQDGERLSETAILARRYPDATVVISGANFGAREGETEGLISARFLVDLGVETSRIVLEGRSLSTAENAAFTRDLLKPQPDQRWLLVTSASHMPRAVGSFRRAGFPVIPYPVGYTTAGLPADYWTIGFQVSTNLVRADIAFHEWLGLFAYWLTGRTDALLPGPASIQD
jgi:uncharacterized SAM-binding protein YcdF (DUF218 family)